MEILDCTLRDGANIVGKGFSSKLTISIIEGLIRSNIRIIEFGNALGLGAYEANGAFAPMTDREYLDLVQPYVDKAELGMFMNWQNGSVANISLAKEASLSFLRVGANAGMGGSACSTVERVKSAGLKTRYSLMKAYTLTPEQLAEEAALLESYGLDEITIMDSAGTMLPEEVKKYVETMKNRISIPIGFHGHNNLGLSVANALAARDAGAELFDTGLMGMARSAGNLATEVAIAVFQRQGQFQNYDLYQLLDFIDHELAPEMMLHNYQAAISPNELILGVTGCHSSFEGLFNEVAAQYNVPVYPLISRVSRNNKRSPSRELIQQEAQVLSKFSSPQ